MKYFHIFLFAVLVMSNLPGQDLTSKWNDEVTYSIHFDDFIDAGVDDLGNVYLLGSEENSSFDLDIVLVKYNISGLVWERTYDGGHDDVPKALAVDEDGNAYIVGSTDADGAGKIEALVVKYSSTGSVTWTDAYNLSGGSSGIYDGIYNDVAWDGSNLYAVGTQYSGAAVTENILIAQFTSSGTRTLKSYDNGYSKEYGRKIALSDDHLHLIAIVDPDGSGFGDLRYLKLDKGFSSSTTPDRDQLASVSWNKIVALTASADGNKASVVRDAGASTSFLTFSGGSTYSYSEADLDDVKDAFIYSADLYLTGSSALESVDKLVFARYNAVTGVRSFLEVYETSTGSTDHGFYSSVGAKIYKKNSGDYFGVLGTLVEEYNDGHNHRQRLGEVVFRSANGNQLESFYGVTENFNDAKLGFITSENVYVLAAGINSVDMSVLCVQPDFSLGSNKYEVYSSDGNSFELDAGEGYSEYLWSTGETTQTITVTTAGEFAATVTNANGCSATKYIETFITKADQVISWSQTLSATYRDTIDLVATSSSGLDVTFVSSDNEVAEPVFVTDHWELRIKKVAEVTITAQQSGDDNYNAATEVSKTFTSDYAKFYWVGGDGLFETGSGVNSGHWATSSGGATQHSYAPDEYCDIFFDEHSFTGPSQEVRSPSGGDHYCHDFTATDVTNNPTFELNKLTVYGDFSFSKDAIYLTNYLYFWSDEEVDIDFDGSLLKQAFETLNIYFYGAQYNLVGDLEENDNGLRLVSGILKIAPGVTVTIHKSINLNAGATLVNNGTLIFESGAAFYNQVGSSFSGNDFQFKRNTTFDETKGRYSIVGSPVSGATTGALGKVVYSYDESADYGSNEGLDRFITVSSPETMDPGTAYFSAYTGTITVEGVPNTGTINVPLEYTTSTGDESAYDGWNLVSNPYPSRLMVLDNEVRSVEGFLDTNGPNGSGAITGAIYIWADGGSNSGRRSNADYLIVNELGEVSGNEERSSDYRGWLGTFQGFFVRATGPGKTLTFTPEMRDGAFTSADGWFFRKSQEVPSTLKVKVRNASNYSETLIGFHEEAHVGLDDRFDAPRLSKTKTLSISSIVEGEYLGIQGRPMSWYQDTIRLAYEVDQSGMLSMSFENEINGNVSNVLHDHHTGQTIDLSIEDDYNFFSEKGAFTDRFELHINSRVLAESNRKTHVYAHGQSIYINLPGGEEKTYELVSMDGQRIFKTRLSKTTQIQTNLPGGVYIISDGEQSYKIILK
ncbi:MAG: SBBP repeat-containing protein [Marinoscillum sp.]